MLKLNKMTESDYKIYIDKMIVDYAQENVKAGYWDKDEALQKAKEQTYGLLKDGVNTENHYLFSVFEDELKTNVGILWVNVRSKGTEKSAFIYDIELDKKYQGKGYGKTTLEILETWCKMKKISSIGLHVFAHNSVARNLYLKFGYEDISFNMVKKLK